MMLNMDHAKFYMGDYINDVINITQKIKRWKRLSMDERIKYVNDLISYYEFDNADMMVGDIMLERNQIIFDANISRDSLIALARKGIIVVQKRRKREEM